MLLQQWYSYQKELGDDVATYIVKIENLAHQLQTLGKKIPNQMIITKIPSSFKYFIVCENQLNPTKGLSQILFQDSPLRKQE